MQCFTNRDKWTFSVVKDARVLLNLGSLFFFYVRTSGHTLKELRTGKLSQTMQEPLLSCYWSFMLAQGLIALEKLLLTLIAFFWFHTPVALLCILKDKDHSISNNVLLDAVQACPSAGEEEPFPWRNFVGAVLALQFGFGCGGVLWREIPDSWRPPGSCIQWNGMLRSESEGII